MEMVDIVDEQTKTLYQERKDIAHEKGLLHKCVIAEIINSKGQFMLVQQHDHKQDAGQFVSPVGGHVSAGEINEEALKRETLEEVGIKNFKYKYIGRMIFDRFVLNRHENHFFIIYEIYTDDLPKLGDEAATYKYFTPDEIKTIFKEKPGEFGDAFHAVAKKFYQEFIN